MNTCKNTNRISDRPISGVYNQDHFFMRSANQIRHSPEFNIIRNERGTRIQIALPGYEKTDVQIEQQWNLLKVFSTKNEAKNNVTIRTEFRKGAFTLLFNIQEILDLKNMEALMENGILTLDIPLKTKEVYQIQVQ
jgi:HSP20 family molecular chaperone IbpA